MCFEKTLYTLCKHCDHFVDENDIEDVADGIAPYVHLEDGEQEFDHEPKPSEQTWSGAEWKKRRPDLFLMYADGKIGPNSRYHSQRGKLSGEASFNTFALTWTPQQVEEICCMWFEGFEPDATKPQLREVWVAIGHMALGKAQRVAEGWYGDPDDDMVDNDVWAAELRGIASRIFDEFRNV